VRAAAGAALSAADAAELAQLLDVVADPVRARILTALAGVEELCVGDLALAVGVSEDAVSYGLRILRASGLVERRPHGRMAYYRRAPRSRGSHGARTADALAQLRDVVDPA
jgi:ArsR family transcriptional regulator, lead/cadmium/zinc/bismuth-responsive transcriptional repressor